MRIKLFIVFIFFCGQMLFAQQDSVTALRVPELKQNQAEKSIFWPALLIPGVVQVEQNRLKPAAFYYFTGMTFYYRSFYNLVRYEAGHDKKYLTRFRADLGVAGLIHLSSTLDAVYASHLGLGQNWNSDPFSPLPLKSPWAASLRSAIFPGWGQVYNESYIKAVIYLGVDGYFLYQAREADIRYKSSGKSSDREERSKYNWYFGLAYLMTILDAHVDAYLYGFEKTMQLTVEPEFGNQGILVGISYSF